MRASVCARGDRACAVKSLARREEGKEGASLVGGGVEKEEVVLWVYVGCESEGKEEETAGGRSISESLARFALASAQLVHPHASSPRLLLLHHWASIPGL